MESVPWVRCALGNVLLTVSLNHLFLKHRYSFLQRGGDTNKNIVIDPICVICDDRREVCVRYSSYALGGLSFIPHICHKHQKQCLCNNFCKFFLD